MMTHSIFRGDRALDTTPQVSLGLLGHLPLSLRWKYTAATSSAQPCPRSGSTLAGLLTLLVKDTADRTESMERADHLQIRTDASISFQRLSPLRAWLIDTGIQYERFLCA